MGVEEKKITDEKGEEIGVFDKEGYEIDTFEVLEDIEISLEKPL